MYLLRDQQSEDVRVHRGNRTRGQRQVPLYLFVDQRTPRTDDAVDSRVDGVVIYDARVAVDSRRQAFVQLLLLCATGAEQPGVGVSVAVCVAQRASEVCLACFKPETACDSLVVSNQQRKRPVAPHERRVCTVHVLLFGRSLSVLCGNCTFVRSG